MVQRIVKRYESLGGVLHTSTLVTKILIENEVGKSSGRRVADGILLSDGNKINADAVICACDTGYTFGQLLDEGYMPKALKKMYEERELYPVASGFQLAYAVDGKFDGLSGTRVFPCRDLKIAAGTIHRMTTNCFDYEPSFAPEGKSILQTNFSQDEKDYAWWEECYQDKERYGQVKQQLAAEALTRLIE